MPELRQLLIDEDDVSQRRGGIGGSDSPVILGVSPFQTRRDLALEKLGLREASPSSRAMERGKALEAIVADLYANLKGRGVEIVKQKILHPQRPYLWAHIDRRVHDPSRKDPGVLEIKCPGAAVYNKCKREGLQDYYIIQLQHYLGVTGMKWGAFAVFSAEQWEMIEFDVPRNDRLIEIIFAKDAEFWAEIQEGHVPEDEIEVPEELQNIPTGEVLKLDRGPYAVEWSEMIREYRSALAMRDEGDALLEIVEERIKAMMAQHEASIAEGSGARIYWREQKGKQKLDKKAFVKGAPKAYEIYESYLKTGKPSRPFKVFFPKTITLE